MKSGVQMEKVKEAIDTKAIEEKALNNFKSFIEDSKVISQFIKTMTKNHAGMGICTFMPMALEIKNTYKEGCLYR